MGRPLKYPHTPEGDAARYAARLDAARRATTKRYYRYQAWLWEYKLEHGCMDCGYNLHAEALDFDHRPGEEKKFNLSVGAASKSWDSIMAEVAKCDVVCANCHRIRSAERRAA